MKTLEQKISDQEAKVNELRTLFAQDRESMQNATSKAGLRGAHASMKAIDGRLDRAESTLYDLRKEQEEIIGAALNQVSETIREGWAEALGEPMNQVGNMIRHYRVETILAHLAQTPTATQEMIVQLNKKAQKEPTMKTPKIVKIEQPAQVEEAPKAAKAAKAAKIEKAAKPEFSTKEAQALIDLDAGLPLKAERNRITLVPTGFYRMTCKVEDRSYTVGTSSFKKLEHLIESIDGVIFYRIGLTPDPKPSKASKVEAAPKAAKTPKAPKAPKVAKVEEAPVAEPEIIEEPSTEEGSIEEIAAAPVTMNVSDGQIKVLVALDKGAILKTIWRNEKLIACDLVKLDGRKERVNVALYQSLMRKGLLDGGTDTFTLYAPKRHLIARYL